MRITPVVAPRKKNDFFIDFAKSTPSKHRFLDVSRARSNDQSKERSFLPGSCGGFSVRAIFCGHFGDVTGETATPRAKRRRHGRSGAGHFSRGHFGGSKKPAAAASLFGARLRLYIKVKTAAVATCNCTSTPSSPHHAYLLFVCFLCYILLLLLCHPPSTSLRRSSSRSA